MSTKAESHRTKNARRGLTSKARANRLGAPRKEKRAGAQARPAGETTKITMSQCDTCGNDYDKNFEVQKDGRTYTFDCFECAIHQLAPACEHCGCRILGHGVEEQGFLYCCASCARKMGRTDLRDRGDIVIADVSF